MIFRAVTHQVNFPENIKYTFSRNAIYLFEMNSPTKNGGGGVGGGGGGVDLAEFSLILIYPDI